MQVDATSRKVQLEVRLISKILKNRSLFQCWRNSFCWYADKDSERSFARPSYQTDELFKQWLEKNIFFTIIPATWIFFTKIGLLINTKTLVLCLCYVIKISCYNVSFLLGMPKMSFEPLVKKKFLNTGAPVV